MTLSMSKLLKNTILLSSLCAVGVFASSTDAIEDYLSSQLDKNPMVKDGDVQVVEKKPLKEIKGWDAYIVKINVTLKKDNRNIHQKDIFFSNGKYVSADFTDIQTGESLKEKIKPKFLDQFYKKENLISGSSTSKHKVAIFSDPLCPFCRQYVPEALRYMMKDPEKFAVYYYNLPLPNLHPASVVLVQAEIAAELKGYKADILKLYTEIQPDNPKKPHFIAYRERDVKKILKLFNEVMGTNLTPQDLSSEAVKKRFEQDMNIAEELMVRGTPTVYFDGEFDKTKRKYKKVK